MPEKMSLVGSSVNVVSPNDHQQQQHKELLLQADDPASATTTRTTEDDATNLMTSYHTAYHDGDDVHPPPTPPGAAESLFLSGLHTHSISASALAQQIHQRHRPISLAGTSIATDDFASATDALPCCNNSSLLVEPDDSDEPFGNDALIHSREVIDELQENMAKTTTTTTKTATTEEPMHMDPAEKFYDTAKGVWGWGKGIIIFSPFMGMAEGIAGKIVETAGSNLEE